MQDGNDFDSELSAEEKLPLAISERSPKMEGHGKAANRSAKPPMSGPQPRVSNNGRLPAASAYNFDESGSAVIEPVRRFINGAVLHISRAQAYTEQMNTAFSLF